MEGMRVETFIGWWMLTRELRPHTEYQLPDGSRLDVAGISDTAKPVGVEVKRTQKDFNRDVKWPRYLPFCSEFWFAVPEEIIPQTLDLRVGILAWRGPHLLIVRQAATLKIFS